MIMTMFACMSTIRRYYPFLFSLLAFGILILRRDRLDSITTTTSSSSSAVMRMMAMMMMMMIVLFTLKVNLMPKNLWVRNNLIQETGIGEDGFIDLGEFVFVAKFCEEVLIRLGQREKIFSSSVVRSQLVEDIYDVSHGYWHSNSMGA